MSPRQNYIDRLEESLDELCGRARTFPGLVPSRAPFGGFPLGYLCELDAAEREVREQLRAIEAASEESWEPLRAGADVRLEKYIQLIETAWLAEPAQSSQNASPPLPR